MLDKISYSDNGNGTLTKQTVSNIIITQDQFDQEAIAIKAQLNDFSIGRSSDVATQADIDETIQSYNDSLASIKAAARIVNVPISVQA